MKIGWTPKSIRTLFSVTISRSSILRHIKSGSIGINITHQSQDTAVPFPYN